MKQEHNFPKNPEEKCPYKMECSPLLERAACRRLFRGAVKGILDQSQRRIKTSAPHFTSISPTLLEHCASAVEVNKGWLFVLLHTATHSSLTRSISPIFPLSPLFFPFASHCHSTVPVLPLPPIGHEISSHCTLSICFHPSPSL